MRYYPELDGLRAVAVTSVVVFHCNRAWLPGGFVGVDLFFVLSGFLISSILLEEHARTGTIAFSRFYLRRALRLWPALMLMLGAYLMVAPAEIKPGRDVLLAGLYLSDYSQAFWRVPNLPLLHTWSLAVEEHFYLIWPGIVLFLARTDRRIAIGTLIAAFAIATAWRMIDLGLWLDFRATFYRFDTRMSGLILGSLVAFVPWRPNIAVANWMGLAGAAIIAWAMVSLQWGTPAPLLAAGIVVDLGAAAIVIALASGGSLLGRVLKVRPLTFIGMISYSIYLWHYPMVVAMRADQASPLSASATAAVVLSSVAIAAGSFFLIEKPLRERWRGTTASVASA